MYLLDESVKMDKIGLIFANLAENMAFCVTWNPYRVTADIISSTSGQKISHGGVWKWCRSQGKDGLILHSGQRGQYTSKAFVEYCVQ